MNDVKDIISRVEEYESKLDRVTMALSELDAALDEYQRVRGDLDDLREYLDSGQWRKDYEADERGDLPKDLKRGVLTEDAIWDLLEREKEIRDRLVQFESNLKI